jgi:hypothetical protein
MNIFEQASRLQLRWESPKGLLTVEDLWTLPLTSANRDKANLDAIAVALHRKTRDAAETVSFVNPTANVDKDEDALRFEIVKYVIGIRQEENKLAADAKKRSETKQRVLEIIAQKEGEALSGKSIEELRAFAASL